MKSMSQQMSRVPMTTSKENSGINTTNSKSACLKATNSMVKNKFENMAAILSN